MATLTKKRQREIEKKIKDIPQLTKSWTYPEVGLIDLCMLLGVNVDIIDMNIGNNSLDGKKFVGAIKFNKEEGAKFKATIFVDSMIISFPERRFIIAHELGHFLLHDGDQNRLETTDYSSEEPTVETEADFFAASLLMPKETVLELINNGSSLDEMKDIFKVSKEALINRIRWISSND